jgi:pyridoxine 5-phosphate synthase
MVELGVNIDHVATIRQARRTYEPDPVWAAVEAELGGADGITVHLREDRRHIQDHDVERIKQSCHVKLNLEMAATDEMVAIACKVKPHMAMLVPEGRTEVTTEGGLDVARQQKRLSEIVKRLKDAGTSVSAFIDADFRQIDAAAAVGVSVCEVHTGPFAHAFHERQVVHIGDSGVRQSFEDELRKVDEAGERIRNAGMQFNAGHALNYLNVRYIAALPGVRELHIGHAIVSRAVFVGLREAVREMKRLMNEASTLFGRQQKT